MREKKKVENLVSEWAEMLGKSLDKQWEYMKEKLKERETADLSASK